MKRQTIQVAWIALLFAIAIAGFFGVQTFRQFARMEEDALEVCHAYLESETGERIDLESVETTAIEVVFPKPFHKRFRTTCTFGEVTVTMQAKPLGNWTVIGTNGLD